MKKKMIAVVFVSLLAFSFWLQFVALRFEYADTDFGVALSDFLGIAGLVFSLSGVGGTLGGAARLMLRLRLESDLNRLRKEVFELLVYAGVIAVGVLFLALREFVYS